MTSFEKDVIERSHQIPVLVDFWAEWCGPCRILGPVLEELAESNKGRFELVKIDTEQHQEVAMAYRIMSIPAVKLFHRGEVIAEFVGALPKTSIERWLDQYVPEQQAIQLSDILANEKTWPDEEVRKKLEGYLEENPDAKSAEVALAKHIVLEDPARASALIAGTTADAAYYDTARDVQNLVDFLTLSEENGSRAGRLLLDAREAFKLGEREQAIKHILDATLADKHYSDDMPRRAGIAVFRFFGDTHPLTLKYRKIFNMYLD